MTELTEQQNEAMEHAEHSAHAAESGDPLTLRVTLSIAIMAVIGATIGALGETEAAHTFVEKNEAVLAQAKASDAWTNYQAESLKKHVYDLGAAIAATPEAAQKLKDQSDRFSKEQPDIQATAKRFEADVEERGKSADRHFERHHTLTVAEGIVHAAVAGASIALLSRRPKIWYGALLLTVAGIILAAAAYLI
ncbi:MAG TPA: DUF4337 family protein [Alphaproteobacteria bacterium]|nr:DUF4337 family protein [Alphaproteobacteria bacterium]